MSTSTLLFNLDNDPGERSWSCSDCQIVYDYWHCCDYDSDPGERSWHWYSCWSHCHCWCCWALDSNPGKRSWPCLMLSNDYWHCRDCDHTLFVHIIYVDDNAFSSRQGGTRMLFSSTICAFHLKKIHILYPRWDLSASFPSIATSLQNQLTLMAGELW